MWRGHNFGTFWWGRAASVVSGANLILESGSSPMKAFLASETCGSVPSRGRVCGFPGIFRGIRGGVDASGPVKTQRDGSGIGKGRRRIPPVVVR